MEDRIRIWKRVQPFFTRARYQVAHTKPEHELDTELAQVQAYRYATISSLGDGPEQTTFKKSAQVSEDITSSPSIETGAPNSFSKQDQHARWISGVYMCARCAAVVLLINLIFIAVAGGLDRNHHTSLQFSGSRVFYEGSCTVSKRWDTALHLIINALSTCMLGASNHCMQSLVAPTREEVDACHAQGKWLDIGNASVRNLFSIAKSRTLLWLVLMITATPFHVLYNSIVFESLSTNEFAMFIGPHDLTSENVMSLTTPGLENYLVPSHGLGINDKEIGSLSWGEYSSAIAQGDYKKLTLEECQSITKNSNAAGTKVLTVLVKELSVEDGGDRAILATGLTGGFPNSKSNLFVNWEQGLAIEGGALSSDMWYNQDAGLFNETFGCASPISTAVSVFTSQECLEISAEEKCQLLLSAAICIVVALTAAVKVIAMFLAARISRSRSVPLLTVGDAVASFMTRPDLTTMGFCWMSKKDVHCGVWKPVRGLEDSSEASTEMLGQNDRHAMIRYRTLTRPKWYMQVPSKQRWAATYFLCFACIGTAAAIFQTGVLRPNDTQETLDTELLGEWWSQGFGASNYNIIGIHVPMTMLGSVVIANIPQLLITLSYYCYNNVLTDMLAAGEYNSYGITRKPLRVSRPVKGSEQRSTYWLSVPYRYALPLMVLYMILHWLVSQGIFYVLVIPYDLQGNVNDEYKVDSLGYSPLPVFVAILVASLMICILAGLGLKRFKSDLPVAGGCSVAISAACHPPKGENLDTVALGPVKWGQTLGLPGWALGQFRDEVDGRGHCSFTALDTVKPTLTKIYA
ncbi:unnamed protein product [Penicillium salamii]|uniref:DUF6536 domain-containing protein n=1 Tax=Penicillium salamii TaxID=1612424 RepID=A0A9W4J2F8_9EURO|nr:unnamed protein product [Penicillium salamii]CAG8304141.1 unnamed protein product [Penicillium salamii]CAG8373778.1 unnamed protein product [Penicillium salamii]CAG8389989.1 unnamed protein product [Penicillium salamii]CAG8408508.1 unnamed protein product [Penicillium salamii]